MNAILARQHNGSYSLLRLDPIVETVAGTDHKDVYVRPGDPIGYRNMCAASICGLLSLEEEPMTATGETMKVEAFLVPRQCMTPELRRLIRESQGTQHEATFKNLNIDCKRVLQVRRNQTTE